MYGFSSSLLQIKIYEAMLKKEEQKDTVFTVKETES